MKDLRFKVDPTPDAGELVMQHLPSTAEVTVSCPPATGIGQTLETALKLADRGHPVIPHLPARRVPSPSFLRTALSLLAASGIRSALVMAGDGNVEGPYTESLHLMEDIAEFSGGSFRIGIVCHPEAHPHLPQEAAYASLSAKQHLAHDLTTQICLDQAVVRSYLLRLRQNGIHLPVWLGTPGAVSRQQLAAAVCRLGIGSSRKITRTGPLSRRLFKDGNFDVERYIDETGPGFAGSHISTFNKLAELPQSLLTPTQIGAFR